MQGFRRTIVALSTAGLLLAMAGCGGLGVNIGSGAKGSSFVGNVGIQTVSGINVLNVLLFHTLLVQAVATGNGTSNLVSSVQGAVWAVTPGTGGAGDPNIVLLEPGCNAPYGGEPQQSVCIQAVDTGDGISGATNTQQITATVQGVTGVATVTVQT